MLSRPVVSRPVVLLALAASAFVTLPAGAQYSGGLSASGGGEVPDVEAIQQRAAEARWRLGPLRVAPWLGIRDASFVRDAAGETDFTAGLGAGIRAYVRATDRVLLASQVLPEYRWWAEDSARNGIDGRAGVALFTDLRRLQTELSFRGSEVQELFSSEAEELATQESRAVRAAAELAITPKIQLAGSFTQRELELDEGPGAFAALDREEERANFRLAYLPRDWWRLEVGYEVGSDDFASDARSLSNDFDALLFLVALDGNRIGGSLELSERSLEPDAGSALPATDVTTYEGTVSVEVSRRLGLELFSRRQLHYALAGDAGFFLADRFGIHAQSALGAVTLDVEVATGEDDFRALAAGGETSARSEDVTSYAAQASLRLKQLLSFTVGVRHIEHDSSLPGFDRETTLVTTGLEVDLLPARLRQGDAGGW